MRCGVGGVINLRYYQKESVDATFDFLCNRDGNALICHPTGAGKSVVIAELARRAVTDYGGKVIILQHRKELIEQNAAKVRVLLPEVEVGIFSAGLGLYENKPSIVCAGIQSVYKHPELFAPRNLVICDECHLIPNDGEGMYRTFLGGLEKCQSEGFRVVGLTATPFRTGEGKIYGEGRFFSEMVYNSDIIELIDQGFLCDMKSGEAKASVDTSKLHRRAGEFIAEEVEELFSNNVTVDAVNEIVNATIDRHSVMIFATSVKHACYIENLLHMHPGVSPDEVGTVFGNTSPLERASTIAAFVDRRIKFLVNVDVLTTGFDAPCIDAIAILRATASPGLYAQIVGRGLRVHESKADCIAEGQRVLTDHGLVEIQNVTTEMKVWDGVDFVSHCGIILRGELPVISYAGLTATGDHNVYTEKGWMSFRDAKQQKIGICVTGNDGTTIRESENLFRSDCAQRARQSIHHGSVFRVRRKEREGFRFCSVFKGWMQKMWKKAKQSKALLRGSKVAAQALLVGQAEMHQSAKSILEELRREGDRIRIRVSKSYGCVFNERVRNHKRPGDRSNRQRQRILSGKLASGSAKNKCEQSTGHGRSSTDAQIQNALSRGNVCGQHIVGTSEKNVIQGSYRKIPQEIEQAKRRVWDILNCGPRHRFTCEGLLVSNCVVLDFGENIKRHGSIDRIRAKRIAQAAREKVEAEAKEKQVGVKECPKCEVLNLETVPECECGYVFPVEGRHNSQSESTLAIVGKTPPQVFDVIEVEYSKWSKPDKPDTMRVDYRVSKDGKEVMFGISEWICFDHTGYARKKAEEWWLSRSCVRLPDTTADAITMATLGATADPTQIVAEHDGKYWTIKHAVVLEKPNEYEELEEAPF